MASFPVPDDQRVQSGSTIIIEELDVVVPGGKARKITLAGSGLPFMGQAKWSASQKVVTSWFVGNGLEASQQVLGPQLMPSTWQGRWTRTRLSRTPVIFIDDGGITKSIVDPHRVWEVFEMIRTAGARLRVTWSLRGTEIVGKSGRSRFAGGKTREIDFSIVREGRLTMNEITPERWGDIPWSMNFDWCSAGGTADRVASVRKDDDPASASQSIIDSIDALQTYTETAALVASNPLARLSASKFSLGKLEALANAPLVALTSTLRKLQYASNQLKRACDIVKKISNTPDALAGAVTAWANNTKEIGKNIQQTFSRTPIELMSKKQRPSELLRSAAYFGKAEDQTRSMSRQALELELRLRRISTPGGLAGTPNAQDGLSNRRADQPTLYVAREGDTPTSVSVKFYKNPDQVVGILKANRLPLHLAKFPKGKVLVIPAVSDAKLAP